MNIKRMYEHTLKNNGVTVSLNSAELPKKGYAVALLPNEKQVILGKYTPEIVYGFIEKNRIILKDENMFLGIWLDNDGKEDSIVYLDTVKIYQGLKDAVNAGRDNKQRAIYDLSGEGEIKL